MKLETALATSSLDRVSRRDPVKVYHKMAVRELISQTPGFHAYYLIKTGDGAVSMTVCENRSGAEESNRAEATWLKDKLPTFATRPPEITTGELRIHLNEQPVKVRV